MKDIALPLLILFLWSSAVSAETLDEAWHIASRVNHQLQAQRHQVEAAKSELKAARSARNPVLTNRSAYVGLSEAPSFNIDLPDFGAALPFPVPPGTFPSSVEIPLADRQFAVSATTVAVPLYTGGKINAGIDAQRYRLRATQAAFATSHLDIKLEVAEAYFNVLRARQFHKVAQDAEKTLFRHFQDVEKLLRQKIVTKNAKLAAQTAWAAAAQEVFKAENTVQIAEAAYNRYLGRPLDYPVSIDEMPIPPASGDLDLLTAEAMKYRKELAQIASQSQATAALSRAIHADRLPQVVAMGGHSYFQNSHMNQESLWAGGVGMQWTPLDGGVGRARQRAALQASAAANRMREETRSLIELQVRAAWTTEQETRSRIEVAELGRRQADENLRVVTRQFQEGLINHTEVLDAQTLKTVAEMNYYSSTYDAILSTYRLRRAVGLLY